MKNRLSSIAIVFLMVIGGFVGFVNMGSENAQGTFVSGIVYDGSGGPWTMAGNPYIVVDNVTVPAGETLTIEPGVEVKFDGYYSIYVEGTLTAVGTETMRIIITSNKPSPASGDWKGIRVTSSGHIEIKYCDVSYSAFGIRLYPSSNNIISNNILSYTNAGIKIEDSSNDNIITHNNILNNRNGIQVRDSSNNTIIHNNILNNDLGIGVRGSNNIIAYNNVSDNDIGISLWHSSNNTLTNNNFVNDGISMGGDQLSHFNSHTIPDNNIVNGKPLYYYKNCSGITIDGIPVGELILANCTDFDVKNLQINNTDVGIEVAYSTNISISDNNLSSNDCGIDLYSSSYNKIINNDISNGWGIHLTTSSNNNIIANNNILSNNSTGIRVGGGTGGSSNNNVITNNNILSNNSMGIGIGIGLATYDNSLNNTVTGNNVSNNMYGIYIHYTSENKVIRNNISDNDCGIIIHFSTANDVTNNSISNGEYGLYFYEGANDNVITGNTVSNHDYGVNIYFYGPSNNRFYHNNFINNTNQACDDTNNANQWDNGYPSGGNYWSDFDEPGEGAYDDYHGSNQDILGSDGIVDNGSVAGGGMNPYVIDADSQDNYPLLAPPPLPPTLYINIGLDGKNATLYWDPPSVPGIDHYLLYRSTSQTNFDFNTVWKNTSINMEVGESSVIPLRTIWNDTNAAFPGNKSNYEEQYYYVIRAVNVLGQVSSTSRTVGKWTKTFPQGVSTFSLPLEPFKNITIDYCLNDMNASSIKWMNQTTHTWMKHGDGVVNNTQMKLGEGYEVKFGSQTNYTFTGVPGAMISYDDDTGLLGFDPTTDAKNFTVSVEPNGNVILTWQEPTSMVIGDWYEIYYSNKRDGFFGTPGIHYGPVCPPVSYGNNTATHEGAKANDPGARLYYMVVPFNAMGIRGASTYSIGIWTEEYLSQYDTIGIPLKLSSNHTADWYCDNIPDTVGINYFIYSEQRWSWHSTRMPGGAYDPILKMTEEYQISTSNATKFTFIGV